MQRMTLKFINFKKISLLCLLLTLFFASLFAGNFIISPVEGEWQNFQALVIDVPEKATAFYSFTGDDPLVSGFAYDEPVNLEIEGKVNLQVALVYEDGTSKKESVSYVSGSKTLDVFGGKNAAIFLLGPDSSIEIPSDLNFSIGDASDIYLKGKSIQWSKENCLEELLPLYIKNADGIFRYMFSTNPSVKADVPPVTETESEEGVSLAEALLEEPKLIEKSIKECPFVLEFVQWNNLFITVPEKFSVCVDNGNWQSGNAKFKLDRSVEHQLLWLDTSVSDMENFNGDNFTVFYCKIPAKPSLISEVLEDKSVQYSIDSSVYDLTLIQNMSVGKSISPVKKSFVVDTVYGHELKSDVQFMVYYEGVQQGSLSAKTLIDKLPPKSPKISASADSSFVRNEVNLKFDSDADVYCAIKSSVIPESEIKQFAFSEEFYPSCKDGVLIPSKKAFLESDEDNVVLYTVVAYALDLSGNRSDLSYYNVLIDSANYYFENKASVDYIPDGSFRYPFTSLDQLEKLLSADKKLKIHLAGDFTVSKPLLIKQDCEISSENSSHLSVALPVMFSVKNASVSIKNCVIEQEFSTKSRNFKQINLFNLKDSSLAVRNCEIISNIGNSSSMFVADNSKILVENSGLTLQSADYGSIFNGINSSVVCKNDRISLFSDTSVVLSLNGGKCEAKNCAFQIYGYTSKFYQFYDVDYSMKKNRFFYKNYADELFSADILSKKLCFEENVFNEF